MSYITQQVVGTGYEPQAHDTINEAVLAIAQQIAEHISADENGTNWVNCEFSTDGVTDKVITISLDMGMVAVIN